MRWVFCVSWPFRFFRRGRTSLSGRWSWEFTGAIRHGHETESRLSRLTLQSTFFWQDILVLITAGFLCCFLCCCCRSTYQDWWDGSAVGASVGWRERENIQILWQYTMVYDDIWWYMMIYDDIWWYMMVYGNIIIWSYMKDMMIRDINEVR